MKKIAIISIFIAVFVAFIYFAYAINLPKWFPFSEKNSLNEWQERIFKNKVLYVVQAKGKEGYLLAKSDRACSGLLYTIKFDSREFPMMSWKWKVIKFPKKVAVSNTQGNWIERDDYAARIYVIFPSWFFMHIKCIEYIWDENLPEGKIITSPYFNNIKLIVAESGKRTADEWIFEERNIYEDYKKAFGKAPSSKVGAIALMTDTDNTLSTAEALYTDIKVGYKK